VKEEKSSRVRQWIWIVITIGVVIAIPFLVIKPLVNWSESDWDDKVFSIGIILFVAVLSGKSLRRRK
jgi:hypothetical protein